MVPLVRWWKRSLRRKPYVKLRRSSRLNLEALEDRCVPAAVAPLARLPLGTAAFFSGDFNGDGRTDLAQFTTDGRWLVSLNTSSAGGVTTFAAPTPWAGWSSPASWRQLFTGDFNGDGKTDVAGLSMAGDWFVGLSDGAGSFTTGAPWANFGSGNSGVWTKLFVNDFNGDGKDDVAALGFNGQWFVGLSQHATGSSTDQSTFSVGPSWADFGTGSSSVWKQTFVGDFNGDGKADIAGFGFNGNWFVGLSNGTGAFSVGAPWANWGSPGNWIDESATQTPSLMGETNVFSSDSGLGSRLLVGDFNGDGKTDIAGVGFNGSIFVGLSNGAGTLSTGAAWANLGDPKSFTGLFVGDADGHVGAGQRDDIIALNNQGQWTVALSQSGAAGGSDTFQLSTQPFASFNIPQNATALVVGHNPIDFNPGQELMHPAGLSTEFNSGGLANDLQADIAALASNGSWSAGISNATVFASPAPGTPPGTPSSGTNANDPALITLNLNPLDINLLGLEVQTNQIQVTVSAQPGQGELLGNLLTVAANLVNLPATNNALNNVLGGVVTLLNSASLNVSGVNTTSGPLSTGPVATTPVLDLFVAPVHLNLLGALVDTSPIHLTITAHSGPGLVLGNVVTDLANLFNPPLPKKLDLNFINARLQSLLNELNAQIPGIGSAPITTPPIASGTQQILALTVPPINLNLLGLVLKTSQIQVNANAQTGNGDLLGNVLTTLLNTLGATPQNLTTLNSNLNALLAKIVGVLNASNLTLATNALAGLSPVLQLLANPNLVNATGTATAPILNLAIASTDGTTPPVDVNLLGLVVTTSNIQAQLIAQTGTGQVLGNLLYNVAHLLDPNGTLNLLTILGQLGL
ncbi:MAG: FG-GAP-like repeat-containing protein [Gemmataceae bacterium]